MRIHSLPRIVTIHTTEFRWRSRRKELPGDDRFDRVVSSMKRIPQG